MPAPSRAAAIDLALERFDAGAFQQRLAALVAIPSSSQEPAMAHELDRYLQDGLIPWLTALGFACTVHPNPVAGAGPILRAERIEAAGLPTVIGYGHGDTVPGMDAAWTEGRRPWVLQQEDGHPGGARWYGRGTADNKGQHACNLFALEAVLARRGGVLGYNVKLVIEMAEERGSAGLDAFVRDHAGLLAADLFLGSDGPRVAPGTPTVAGNTRGNFQFDLVVSARSGGVHSGHWGGLTGDPAMLLGHALAAICDHRGRILIPDWLPGRGAPLDPAIRTMLATCPADDGGDAAEAEPGWGEPGLSAAERRYAWTSFTVRAMVSGQPDAPQNAVAPHARAACEIRYVPGTDPATFLPALRQRLDALGLGRVRIAGGVVRMPASTAPDGPWLGWAADSIARSTGAAVQIIPAISGGMPGQCFVAHLGVPLVWVPHGHNGCRQHGPDEHMLVDVTRQGIAAFAGLWWDLGEPGAPWPGRVAVGSTADAETRLVGPERLADGRGPAGAPVGLV